MIDNKKKQIDNRCKHPLKRFVLPDGSSKITSYETKFVFKRNGSWIPATEWLEYDKYTDRVHEFQEIRCGHCIACRLEYSRQWADRMMLELQYHDKACFITLTYDDDHLPKQGNKILYDGNSFEFHSLVKSDLQKFIKKLRNFHRFDDDFKVRFYGIGEYGSRSFRPHYHVILYGYNFDNDRVYFKRSELGHKYYLSPELNKLWGKGLHLLCDVSWETCAYCSRYVTKKLHGDLSTFYTENNIIPEFSLMSRRPGIARQYYDDHKDEIFEKQEINIATEKGRRTMKPPKYYDKLFDIDYPLENAFLKDKKQYIAEAAIKKKMEQTSLSYLDQLKVDEIELENKIKILERSKV